MLTKLADNPIISRRAPAEALDADTTIDAIMWTWRTYLIEKYSDRFKLKLQYNMYL